MIVSKEALHRWIQEAQAVRIWVCWGDDADGSYVPVDRATARRIVDSANGPFQIETNGQGVLYITRSPQ